MALVFNTVRAPDGTPIRTKVEIRLVAGPDPTDPGFLVDDHVTILGRWASGADDNGYWSVELEPNVSISPSNTYYQVIERYPPGNATTRYFIRVPDGATPSYWIGNILIVDPAAIITGISAADVTFVPSGTIVSTNVQDALIELAAEIVAGTGDAAYTHTQASASTSWSVVHNLDKFPSVSIVDDDDNEIEADVTYVDSNIVTITFSSAVTGKAYIN